MYGLTIDNIPPGLETSKRPWLQAGFVPPSITRQVSLGETRLTTGKRFFLKMFWKPTASFEANWLFIVRTVETKLNARSAGLDTFKENTETLYATPFALRPYHEALFDDFVV